MTHRIKFAENLDLSRIVYGMWRVGDDKDTSAKYIQSKIEVCLEQGITTLDLADIYGEYGAEQLVGNCLKQAPHLRDKIEIISKCDIIVPFGKHADKRVKYYDTSKQYITQAVDASLAALNVEQIDLYLIHRPDPFMDHIETGSAIDEMIASGKVKAFGVSNFKPHDWTLLQSATKNKLVTNQIEISLTAHDSFTNGDIAFLQERAIPPMAWSPLGGGSLFNGENKELTQLMEKLSKEYSVDTSSIAIAWLLAHPAQILPILGTNNLSRLSKMSDADKVTLDRQTWFELYTAARGEEVA